MKKKHLKARNRNQQLKKPTRKRIGKLKTAKDVVRYIARCIKKGEAGGDSTAYYRQVVMSSILLKAIETATFEDRIARIEDAVKKQMEKQNELGRTAFENRGGLGNRDASQFE